MFWVNFWTLSDFSLLYPFGSCHSVNFVAVGTVNLHFTGILKLRRCQPVFCPYFGTVRPYFAYILVLSAYSLKLQSHHSEAAQCCTMGQYTDSRFADKWDVCLSNCLTPNPYPSPIHPVGVSIIILKLYSYSQLYSISTH